MDGTNMFINSKHYSQHEKIAGRDFFLKVWWYRLVVLVVDLLSMAGLFATVMTIILYKFFKVFLLAIDKNAPGGVLVALCTLGAMILAIFTFAWTYFAARKYTPPIVEALAIKISGGKHDIDVPVETGNGNEKVVTNQQVAKPPTVVLTNENH